MSTDLRTIRNTAITFLAFAAFLSAMMGLVFIDVVWMHNSVPEISFTEITQEAILAIITLLFYRRAGRLPEERPLLLLVAGFFGCMLIRELDFLFDRLAHGSWFWFALVLTVVSVLLACRQPRLLVSGLARFIRDPGWGMMSAGMLTVLVFSRFFGMHELWQTLMADDYNRTVKNMAEEGSELLGYSLCLFATLIYILPGGKGTEQPE